ncbi:hypothetical protein BJ508DRAFT_364382 [Ascobolus immersus RN42]|uniref:Uncharacterized protein n=1 Tax=Ascobolus immersus RN42 TaxID=1160509 RepID=A0A3N4HUN4_ASCIM|nr:hypothetical protein BJ508DRAFT_364382 [Ascobolus immersus RN42]
MPQGILKPRKPSTLPSKAKSGYKAGNSGLKKGGRVLPPKQKGLKRSWELQKKCSGGIIKQTEKSLAAKAGHLEILKGGKKERKEIEAEKAAKAAKANGTA